MRVLVVGTVPPAGGEQALALGVEAGRLAAEGHDVAVLSSDIRAAAHHHARLVGFRLPFRLAAGSRRFDRLLLRLEHDLPFRSDTQRGERALLGGLLSWAVRGFSDVTLWLDSPVPIPGGLGGRTMAGLWDKAARIVVANEEDRLRVLEVPGVAPDKVVLAEPLPAALPDALETWPTGGDGPSDDPRADILDLVRARADASRRSLRDRPAEDGERDLRSLLLVEGDPTLERRAIASLVLHRALRPLAGPLAGVRRRLSRPLQPVRRARARAARLLRPYD